MKTGYKSTYDGICNGESSPLQYEIGKTYKFNGEIKLCEKGFHYCNELKNVFNYYDINKDIKVFKVEILGEFIDGDDKSVTNKLKVIEEIDISEWQKYDERNNLIYCKNSVLEYWKKYDEKNNLIHYKDSNGIEYWKKYDEKNNLIHCKDSSGYEKWYQYDKSNNLIHYKNSSGYEKWYQYDKNNNLIHYKNSNGIEYWNEYDERNNLIYYKDSYGLEWSIEIS